MALIKYNNNSISSLTTAGQLASGSLVPISEQTASGSASIEFTTGIDSTYPIYRFEFISIHPATDGAEFKFNLSTDGGSNYNVTKTTTHFYTFHTEDNAVASLNYDSSRDLAQSTAFQNLTGDTGNNNDQSLSGSLEIFNPSSNTFVKHFLANTNSYYSSDSSYNSYVAGYGNTTSSINAVKFQMSSGNFDGTIKLYGIKDS